MTNEPTDRDREVTKAVKASINTMYPPQPKTEQLIAAYRAEIEQGKWISVEDRLPEEPSEWMLCRYPHTHRHAIARYIGAHWEGWEGFNLTITHWQPLPLPPKGGE